VRERNRQWVESFGSGQLSTFREVYILVDKKVLEQGEMPARPVPLFQRHALSESMEQIGPTLA